VTKIALHVPSLKKIWAKPRKNWLSIAVVLNLLGLKSRSKTNFNFQVTVPVKMIKGIVSQQCMFYVPPEHKMDADFACIIVQIHFLLNKFYNLVISC